MIPIRISLVILVSIYICPSCYAICENYYVIMEKIIDDYAYYSPIKKDNINWTISNIQISNENNTFDINCVLDLKCDIIDADRPRLLLLHQNTNKNSTHFNDTLISTEDNKISNGTKSNKENFSSDENISNSSTLLGSKEDDSFDLETTTVNTFESGSKFARNFGFDSNKSSEVGVKNDNNSTEVQDNEIKRNNVTELSSDSNNNITNSNNKEIIQIEDTNSTDAHEHEVKIKNVTETSSDSNYNATNIAVGDLHKYNPEESKTLATKVVAGVLGAVATVGVLMLANVGARKLIQHCTQREVYRVPDP